MTRRAIVALALLASCALTMGAGWLSGPRFGPGVGPGFAPMARVATEAEAPASDDFNWVEFDGVDDHIRALSGDFPTGNTSYTVEIWAKPNDPSGVGTLLYHGARTAYFARSQMVMSSNKLVNEGNGTSVFTHPTSCAGAWFHLACRIGQVGPTMSLFVNGVVATSSWSTPAIGAAAYYRVGYNADEGINPYKGKISRWRVYNKYLSDSDIAALATNASWTSVPDGCISQVRVGENATSFTDDASSTRTIEVVTGPLTWGTGKD